MELTDFKPQMLINIKEEKYCTDVNTVMTNAASMGIKQEYSKYDYVVKRELEIECTSDEIKPVLQQNIKKEEMAFGDGHCVTSEFKKSPCNNYTSQLQTVVEQFEINQPDHEIKTEIPFYFTDSMNLKNEIDDDETSHSITTEVNAQNNRLDISNKIKTDTPSDGIDLRNVVFKQSPREGHQFKYETENSNHELNTRDTFERIDTVLDSNSRDAFTTTTNKTDLETAIVRQDAVFSVK